MRTMAARDWQPVEDTRCYGVANFNFEIKGVVAKWGSCGGGFQKIHLGEHMCIKAEYRDWFFVRNVETEEEGLVPKSYVCLKECSVVQNGDSAKDIYPRTPTLVQEINAALREWNKIAKDLYVLCNVPNKNFKDSSYTNNSSPGGGVSVISSPTLTSITAGPGYDETDAKYKFYAIRQHSMKLHEARKKILSSKLTVEELKELKKSVASRIDYGNTLLKLDMVVRDDLGVPLDPAATSTIELFRKHRSSSQKLKKINRGSKVNSQLFTYSTHSLIINVDSIALRVVDECEVRFFLCDVRDKDTAVPFTESIQINMKAGRAPQTPFKFLFTDLGKGDFERQKVYLVAYVVRIGPMEFKEVESKKDNTPFSEKRNNNIQVRRPYGVGAKDISHLFQISRDTSNIDNELQAIHYIPCQGDETMEDTLKKLRAEPGANANGKDTKLVGLWAKINMVAGNPGQIQQDQPLLMRGVSIYARKMGFPEVIMPQDIRNDLYINICRGEFHRTAKTTDRNVEVTVSVHNDRGQTLGPIISGGNGSPPLSQYKSVVYYHNDKPRWNEFLRINLPMSIEDFSTAHVKFTFKHRSSSDNKDKAEKPFALSYLRLKENEGTAIKDATHDLCLYKIDSKHYRENETQYLALPSTRTAAAQSSSKPSCPGFSCSFKDGFFVGTTLCSTNFTQNADLLELLLWVTKLRQLAENTTKNNPDISNEELVKILLSALTNILVKVTKVSGEEIVKFLNPILDALFLILVDPMEQIGTELNPPSGFLYEEGFSSSVTCDRSVFECLLHIFLLMLEHKFQNFQSVLNLYIEDNFSSTLAYNKLAKQLEYSIMKDPPDKLLKVMKCMEFYFKFIIKSFQIHKQLRTIEFGRTDQDRDDDDHFEKIIGSLFNAMSAHLLSRQEIESDLYIAAEGVCLKQIPTVIGDLVKVFPRRKLSEHLVALCCVVPCGKLTGTKLMCVMDIVHSEVFMDTECRFLLLPMVTENILPHLPGNDNDKSRRSKEYSKIESSKKLRKLLGVTEAADLPVINAKTPEKELPLHSEETEKAVELFGDLMHILHQQPIDQKEAHISYVMQRLIRPIILSIGTLGDGDPLAGNMVAIFLAVLREMKTYHYTVFVSILKGETGIDKDPYKQGLLKFVNDVLVVIKNLFGNSYFPADWSAMILLQNSIVLTVLVHFAETIKKEFKDPFEGQPWNNFFHCAVSFLTQPSLQLEEFFPSKRNYILQNYGDMRKSAVELIKNMWFSIYASKRIRFIPSMVAAFLDMAFVPEPEVRMLTIPIFYDMIHCEFDQERIVKNFKEVEDELTKRIVEGFECGKGDFEFRYIFYEEMSSRCEHNTTGLRHQGLAMVQTVTKLMDLLLQYREVIAEEDAGNRMSCIVNLLDFSKEIDRKELYLRYLYKLHDLHIKANNYTEAAFTLKLHSRLLDWSDEEVPVYLRAPNHPLTLSTHMELKEYIYNDIIDYFTKSEMWECALEVCDELRQQYEESYIYSKLPELHQKIASFYKKILTVQRFEPEYFRVAFYGNGFPSFLQDKVYIYRGDTFEKLSVFESRMMCRFLQAELLKTLGVPSDEIKNSNKQYLQICKVDPVMSTTKRNSGMKYADDNIRKYYRVNEIDKFTFSRPYHQEPKDPDNPFASLWLDRYTLWTSQSFPGIMRWFPVIRDSLTKVRPIEHALETLEKANEKMRDLVLAHYNNPDEDLKDLQMKLHGILDPAVMGGVANYEKSFLQPQYLETNPEDAGLIEHLKSLICIQVPIIEECLKIHERKLPASLMPWQKRSEELFCDLVKHIETTYRVEKKNLKDLVLQREIARAEKKHLAIAKRHEFNNPAKESKLEQFSNSAQAGHRGSTAVMKNIGSTTSLYQNPYACKSKGSGSLSKTSIFRRSTHNSFSGSIEGEQNFTQPSGPPISATLPRNGHFFSTSSAGSMLPPLQSEPEGNEEHRIPLTEPLISQRPPRVRVDQRKSQSWNDGPVNNFRRSGDSLCMYPITPAQSSGVLEQPSSRSSFEPPEPIIDGSSDEKPPPLPPKPRGEKNDKPPVPPPKKPPLRQLKEM